MSYKLPEPIIDALLEKLGTDDHFRDLFASNPRGALALLGYGPAADPSVQAGAWICFGVRSLASKEAILAARSTLRSQFSASENPQFPFMLDSTVNPATGRRDDQRHAA
jgi:putative modified peptide